MTLQPAYKNAIYIVDLDSLAEQVFDLSKKVVSRCEWDYAAKIKSQSRQLEYLGGKMFLRLALALTCDILPQDIVFEKNNKGKPLTNSIHPCQYFNISHSAAQLAIFVSDRCNVGIDLEVMDNKRNNNYSDIVERYFHANEFSVLEKASEQEKKSIFYKMWTTKEAIAKQASVDLFSVLKSIDISDDFDCRGEIIEHVHANRTLYLGFLDKHLKHRQNPQATRYIAYCSEELLSDLHIFEHNESVAVLQAPVD